MLQLSFHNKRSLIYVNSHYHLFQAELDTFVKMWNHHYIRRTHNDCASYGRPSAMYELPEMYDTHDFLHAVDAEKIEVCCESDLCMQKADVPCKYEEFSEFIYVLVQLCYAKIKPMKTYKVDFFIINFAHIVCRNVST